MLRILNVSPADATGGAHVVCWSLHVGYKKQGHQSWLAVGQKAGLDSRVLLIPNDQCRPAWTRLCYRVRDLIRKQARSLPSVRRVTALLTGVGEPQRWLRTRLGWEDFSYPATGHLLELCPEVPEILHCHNLHGGYFDLRALPALSRLVPVLLTLHDDWLLTGHCAYACECERWSSGCGHCPDLQAYPRIPRDNAAANWRRKRDIYAASRLWVTTPSRWLMERVQGSMLKPLGSRVIHNGIDLNLFQPGDRRKARALLGIPADARVLLFVANGIRRNSYKDFETMLRAVHQLSEKLPDEKIQFVGLGEDLPPETVGRAQVRFVPFQEAPAAVCAYYHAADVYLHAARADTFPTTILEALACGLPVVATSVGGIPEQIEDGVTGYLTPPSDATAMANCARKLLSDQELRQRLGRQAAEQARRRFDVNRMVEEYIEWYQEILLQSSLETKPAHALSHP